MSHPARPADRPESLNNGSPQSEITLGVIYALLAYSVWGLMPLYWHTVSWVPAEQIVAHRVVWSVLVLALLLAWFGRFSDLWQVLSDFKLLRWLLLSATLISVNWLVFIWAVSNERLLQASLGYFINPLLNIVLGVALLQERLRPWQWVAVGLAALGVLWQVVALGTIPWVSLLLALSFGFYGLVRKAAPVDGLLGLSAETLLLAPVAVLFLLWADPGGAIMSSQGSGGVVLLAQAGLITALPLLWFANAARRLRYATLGFFQYLAPTGHLLLGLWFGEVFTLMHGMSFGLIWLALLIYTVDMARAYPR